MSANPALLHQRESSAHAATLSGFEAVDIFETVHTLHNRSLEQCSARANEMVASDAYAAASGMMANCFFGMERCYRAWTGTWFPVGLWSMLTEETNNALAFLTEVGIDILRCQPFSTLEHAAKWHEATTQPISIGQSPKELVWQSGFVKLWHYAPAPGVPRAGIPLFCVFALMNTPWILDLRPGHSFIEYMTGEGYDVYLADWGCPTRDEKDWNFGTYALGFLPRMVQALKEDSGAEEFSMLGWCIGAILASTYAALMPNEGLRNLILLTPPLDFSDETLVLKKQLKYLDVESLLEANGGIMPAAILQAGAKMLKPVDNYFINLFSLWDKMDDESFRNSWRAMNTWLSMNINIAGGVYRQLTQDLYLGNKLVKGEFRPDGTVAVDLRNIQANVLGIIAEKDHITPPTQLRNAFPLLGSNGCGEKTLWELPGGHIGTMAGSSARKLTWPKISSWLAAATAAARQAQ